MSPQQIEEMAREINTLSFEEMAGEELADTRVALAALSAAAGHALWLADRWLGEYLDATTYPIPEEYEPEPDIEMAAVVRSWSDPVAAAAAFGEAF